MAHQSEKFDFLAICFLAAEKIEIGEKDRRERSDAPPPERPTSSMANEEGSNIPAIGALALRL